MKYSARRLIESRIIVSTAFCKKILLAPLCLNSAQNTSVNRIIRLLLSLLCWPKVILLSGGHCNNMWRHSTKTISFVIFKYIPEIRIMKTFINWRVSIFVFKAIIERWFIQWQSCDYVIKWQLKWISLTFKHQMIFPRGCD